MLLFVFVLNSNLFECEFLHWQVPSVDLVWMVHQVLPFVYFMFCLTRVPNSAKHFQIVFHVLAFSCRDLWFWNSLWNGFEHAKPPHTDTMMLENMTDLDIQMVTWWGLPIFFYWALRENYFAFSLSFLWGSLLSSLLVQASGYTEGCFSCCFHSTEGPSASGLHYILGMDHHTSQLHCHDQELFAESSVTTILMNQWPEFNSIISI